MSNDNAISIIGNQSTQITDGNSSLIIAGNGNDNLTAGTNSIITAGNGTDTIAAAAGSVITVGNGSDTITDGANGLILAGNGNDVITTGVNSIVIAGSGIDIVNAGAGSSIAIGDGNDTIVAGAGSLIVAGNGNDALTAGANSIIYAGNGSDTLIAGNASAIVAGNGNDVVVVGAGSAIVVGNGKDVLTAGAGSTIVAGNGNDTIHIGANSTVTVGSGTDTFLLPTSGQVSETAPTSVTVNEDGSVALAITAASTGFGFGKESIAGFNTTKDNIVVYSSQFANFAVILADAKQVGQNTVITGDAGDTITLQGVKLSSLTASDFTFLNAPISISISGIPAGVTLSDTAGAIAVTNGSATLTPAQLAGLKLTAGEVTAANLTVTTTDIGTGASVSKTIALTVNPVAPTLATPASLTVNAGGTVGLGITETPFDPRDTVSVKITGVPSDAALSAGTKNADGSWTLTPAQLTALNLIAGNTAATTLTVTATNTQGVTAATQKTIQLNIIATIKVSFDTVSFTDTGVLGDHITDNGTVTLSGTIADSLTVTQVQILNGATVVGNAVINNANHTWSLTTNLPNGTYNQLTVKATDSAGNTATATTTQYVQVDTTLPALVSQTESVSGLTQSKTDLITVNATDANGVVSVAIYDDVTHNLLGNAILGNGTWSYNATNLADGAHKFYAVITDAAGNTTKTADLTTVTVDTTLPALVSQTESVSGLTQSKTDLITVNATDANGVVSVAIYDDVTHNLLGNATLSNGTWSYNATNLADGAHKFYAVITDTAGNTTKTADLTTVTVDTTLPALVSQTESVSGLTQSKTDLITVNATDANGVASVAIYDDVTHNLLGNATLGNGTWSYNATNLADGAHKFYAVITDTAGNTTKTADLTTVTVDTTPPVASINGSVSGPTTQISETITITASDANGVASVAINDQGVFVGNATQTIPGIYTLTATNLSQGNHDFTAVVTDNAGNVATSNHVTSLVDTTPPQITFDAVSYDQTGIVNFTKDPAVTMSGTTSDNVTVASVQVFNGNQLLGAAVVDNVHHTWSLTTNLAEGTYANFNAIATDEVGNTGAANNAGAVQSLQVDTTAPTVTLSQVSFVDTGVSNDGITDNSLVTLSGTMGDNVNVTQVEVLNGNQVLGNGVIDNTSHTWSLTTNLADGSYSNLKAEAIDEAGNATIANNNSTTQSLQIATAPPAISFSSVVLTDPTDSTNTVTNDGEVTLSGTVADAVAISQVQVYNGTQLLGAAIVNNGTWTLATTLAQGSYNQLHATATDIVGNSADASTQHIVTVAAKSGQATDGYIRGATVFADTNGDGILDNGEASGITDASGHFTLGPGTTTGNLVLVGGVDTSTGLPFTGVLTASSGSTQVTPLTTLVQAVAAANGGNVAAASQSVATALGLNPSVNLMTTDPLAAAYAGDSQAFVAASKVLNTVSMVASAVSGTGASDYSTAASNAFSALATQIVSNGNLDLNSSTTVTNVVDSTLALTASSSSLTSNQTADIAAVVTNVNSATDQAVADSSGSSTATLLTNVSATSIVAQGSTSSALQQATSGATDLSAVVANNTGTALSNNVSASVSQVGNVAPAPPTFVSLTPTDASPNNLNLVHYTLTFSDPVTGVTASDFSLTTTGLTGASIASITPVTGSNGTQYTVAVNAGTGIGDGTLGLNFTGSTVRDLANNAFADQTTHAGSIYIIDQDLGEQAALSLHVTNTQVNSAGSAIFNFTVGGLQPDDSGTVTFTDGQNKVSVAVSGGQSTYSANLGALSDGPITSSLAVNNDAAGNSFAPVAGTSAVVLSGVNVVNGVSSNNGTLQAVQNGTGDITITSTGAITGQAGDGVIAEQSASGVGNIVVNASGGMTGTGTGSVGLFAENLDAANGGNITVTATGGASGGSYGIDTLQDGNGNIAIEAAATLTAGVQYGIRGLEFGAGSVSVVTDAGSVINSGSSGIVAVNRDTTIAAIANSTITVTNNGTVHSGTINNLSGSVPYGIGAGYNGVGGTGSQANTNVNGTVTLNNNGNITATAGYGIEGYSYGNGNVTVNDGAGTSVSGGQYGIGAFGNSLGAGNIAVNVAANATLLGSSIFGIQAFENEVGSVSVTTSTGDLITGGSSGINAQSQATSDPAGSSVTVIANGTIHSGANLTPNGSTPGGVVAGYSPNGQNVANGNVAGNVSVQSNATIVAAAGAGINAYNYGTGNVTVTTGAASSTTGATTGTQADGINANALNGGNVSVTNGGSVTGGTGIFSSTNHAGTITIENDGQITATALSGINLSQSAANATGSAVITNTGTVLGAASHSAINVTENAVGTITINNSGTIGSIASASSAAAITENGGTVVINNNGQIDGAIYTNSTGGFTGTLNNNAGASWNTGYLDDEGNITASGAGSAIAIGGAGVGSVVGNSAVGNMTIQAGALFSAGAFVNIGGLAGSTGTVTVMGAGSEITTPGTSSGINVGFSGNGTLLLEAGVTYIADFLNIGQQIGSHGLVTVTGAGTTVNTTAGQYQNIAVGFQGAASLAIANQATVTTTNMDVAANAVAGITDTLDINGGALTVGSNITIGDAGVGIATIENGGTLNAGYLTIGNQAGSTGSLTVSGAGSVVQTSGFSLGNGGTATLAVNNGAVVDVNGSLNDLGSISISGGTLKVTGSLNGSGPITLAAGGTLEIGGTGSQTVAFNGGNDILQIDNNSGVLGTITATSSAAGSSTITGAGNITAATGDAIDFTAAGGTAGSPANLLLSPGGAITGAANGINAVQNGTGDIAITSTGAITGQAGDGVIAEQSASGVGNVTINATGSLTAVGALSIGAFAENLNAANTGNIAITATGGVTAAYGIDTLQDGNGNVSIETGGTIASSVQFGARALSFGSGSETVLTDAGSTINSAASGISAANRDTAIAGSANSSITVTNNGTINSGTTNNLSGSVPFGIGAGYNGIGGLTSVANTNVNGTVIINNNGNITAAGGYGIDGYNYGNGNVTVNDAAGTSVSGAQYGIGAYENSKGTGNITINVGANATISATTYVGIVSQNLDVGNTSVTTSAGDVISSGSSGISVNNQASFIGSAAHSTITVIANGTIDSGAGNAANGTAPIGIAAGYLGGTSPVVNNNVAGDVVIQSNAIIVAAGNLAIYGFTYGTGNVTVTTGTTSSISTPSTGTGIIASTMDSGNVSVTNAGSITSGTGINANATKAGNVTVENDGQITATTFSGINVTDNSTGATGSVTIINTGTVVGGSAHSSINVTENAGGTATINNSGTIGSIASASSAAAITENGGTVVINNNGQIDGAIYTNSTGGFTGTLNNNAGASWNTGYLDDEGNITASGAGSAINIGGAGIGASVGNSAVGSLTVQAGAVFSAGFLNIGNLAGSTGTVAVTGAGSEITTLGTASGVNVGFSGNATFTLSAGGALVADFLNIGQNAGSQGAVTITGAGTTVNTTAGQYQNIAVGFQGAASLAIANQATVTTTNMDVAANAVAGITDILDINSGALTVGSNITIGDAGVGIATIENGGTLNAGYLTIGNQAGSTGSLTVSGAGSVVQTSGLSLGNGGMATLAVNNGAVVDVNGSLNDLGSISISGGTLKVTGSLNGSGPITLAAGGTLEIGGTGSQTIAFNGGNDILQIDNNSGVLGTITATSSAAGSSTITGAGNITAATGDAIDFTAAGGIAGSPANIVLSPGGAITGAANGINAVQNGTGDITITSTGAITGQAGDGVIAEQSASGVGNIVVNASGGMTGTGTGSVGLFAENLDAANVGNITVTATGGASGGSYGIDTLQDGNGNIAIEAAATLTAGVQYGIRGLEFGAGSVSVVTDAGSVINSGSSGIVAVNRDTAIAAIANSTITVTNNATIHSGTNNNLSGSVPYGIGAGYNGVGGTGSQANTNVNGTVTLNNNGNITATAGYGIDGYSYGNGNVTVNDGAGTSVSGGQYGIGAYGNSLGAGNIAVNVAANATLLGSSIFGIQAFENEVGSVSVTTSTGDLITGGSSGINAQSQATSDPAGSSVTVIANGTIHSGANLTPNGSTPGGVVAGYSPNGQNVANGNVAGNVSVQSNATIVAAAGAGINAYNYGTGNVTVTTGAASSTTGATTGTQADGINANALNGGNVSVTNGGSLTGGTGLFSSTNHAGSITIENDGQITATALSGINLSQSAANATGSAVITNTGTVLGAASHSAINVTENAVGTITINNSGTIGSIASASSAAAITENSGTVVINNNGQIDGAIYTNSTGGFTGTLNNNAGATWNTGYLDDEGNITASGAGSAIAIGGPSIGLTVGNSGIGNLTIQADAMLTASFLNIGNLAGSHGTVDITGVGSTVNTTAGQYQNIAVGIDGTASLMIANHATVNTTTMDVGVHYDLGVTDTLDINNGALTVGSNITIGDAGTGVATVENGGVLNSGALTIGNQTGGAGSLTVDGAASVANTNSLSLGNNGGSANLTLTHGGAVDVGTTITDAGAVHVGSTASLQGSGTIHGDLVDDGYVGVTGTLLDITGNTTGSGTLSIAVGAHLELGSSVAATDTVAFQGSTGSLALDQSSSFAALIQGFAGNGTLAGSDQIDLKDINYGSGSFSQSFDPVQDTLSLSDGTHSALLHFVGTYVQQNFSFASDGNGGTIVYDPPVSNQTTTPTDKAVSADHIAFNFANLEGASQPASHLFEDIGMPAHPAALLGGQADNHQNQAGPGQVGWQSLPQGGDAQADFIIPSEHYASHFHLV